MGITVFNMVKQLVVLLCKVYPTIILNKIDYNDRYIPKHCLKGSKIEKCMLKILKVSC